MEGGPAGVGWALPRLGLARESEHADCGSHLDSRRIPADTLSGECLGHWESRGWSHPGSSSSGCSVHRRTPPWALPASGLKAAPGRDTEQLRWSRTGSDPLGTLTMRSSRGVLGSTPSDLETGAQMFVVAFSTPDTGKLRGAFIGDADGWVA